MVKIVQVLVQPVREEQLKVGGFVDLQIKEFKLLLLFPGILSVIFFWPLTPCFALFVLSYATSIPLTSV